MTDYLALFRRIPDDIVLSVSSRELDLCSCKACLCAWAAREAIARDQHTDADEVDGLWFRNCIVAAERFGGTTQEWEDIYFGVMASTSRKKRQIETAWVDRLDEAVRRSR